jgi:hypothetical protein
MTHTRTGDRSALACAIAQQSIAMVRALGTLKHSDNEDSPPLLSTPSVRIADALLAQAINGSDRLVVLALLNLGYVPDRHSLSAIHGRSQTLATIIEHGGINPYEIPLFPPAYESLSVPSSIRAKCRWSIGSLVAFQWCPRIPSSWNIERSSLSGTWRIVTPQPQSHTKDRYGYAIVTDIAWSYRAFLPSSSSSRAPPSQEDQPALCVRVQRLEGSSYDAEWISHTSSRLAPSQMVSNKIVTNNKLIIPMSKRQQPRLGGIRIPRSNASRHGYHGEDDQAFIPPDPPITSQYHDLKEDLKYSAKHAPSPEQLKEMLSDSYGSWMVRCWSGLEKAIEEALIRLNAKRTEISSVVCQTDIMITLPNVLLPIIIGYC